MKRIALIKDLIGTAPVVIDQRTRNADGSLRYPDLDDYLEPRITVLEKVWTKKKKDKHGNPQTWLYWQWDKACPATPMCNYSGVLMDGEHENGYALEVAS